MANVQVNQLMEFHPHVEEYLKSVDLLFLLEDPSRIANADEANWLLDSRANKVVVGRNQLAYDIQHANTKASATVMLCHLANGKAIDPMFVLIGKKISAKIQHSTNFACIATENGYMTRMSSLFWLQNVFLQGMKDLKIEPPYILFWDGHSSHDGMEISQFCFDNHIHTIRLIANATHIHQPQDNGIIHPLKSGYDQIVKESFDADPDLYINYEVFVKLFEITFKKFDNPKNTKTAFRICGLYPFDRNAINITKVLGQQAEDQINMIVEKNDDPQELQQIEFIDYQLVENNRFDDE